MIKIRYIMGKVMHSKTKSYMNPSMSIKAENHPHSTHSNQSLRNPGSHQVPLNCKLAQSSPLPYSAVSPVPPLRL